MSAPPDPPPAAPPASEKPAPPKPAPKPTAAEIEARIPAGLRPLRYVGIPSSVLAWKPRLPSRNWSIFFLTVGTLTYLYVDDRRQVRRIQDDYKARVASLGERPLAPSEWPRKISVYACKAPGDEDYDKGVLWFKRYMKPILVSAGVDYEILNGTRHGGLARELASRIHARRRRLAGLEEWSDNPLIAADGSGAGPFSLTPQAILERELDGGTVIVGRPAYKEWFWGLRAGWRTAIPSKPIDPDDILAAELAEDGAFDELEPESSDGGDAAPDERKGDADEQGVDARHPSAPAALPGFNPAISSALASSGALTGASMMMQAQGQGLPRSATAAPSLKDALDGPQLPAVDAVPAQPPVCFVDFTNLVGWRNIPLRMYRFFRRQDDARMGAEAALQVVYGTKKNARPISVPDMAEHVPQPPQGGDLDLGIEGEGLYPPYFKKTPEHIAAARTAYYKELSENLRRGREIARGEREPTKAEVRAPYKSETEYREERFTKEKDWRNLEMGYEVIKPDTNVAWDPVLAPSIRLFTSDAVPPPAPPTEPSTPPTDG